MARVVDFHRMYHVLTLKDIYANRYMSLHLQISIMRTRKAERKREREAILLFMKKGDDMEGRGLASAVSNQFPRAEGQLMNSENPESRYPG